MALNMSINSDKLGSGAVTSSKVADGTLNIGFTGARDTLPHLQRMAVYLGKAVEDLEELVVSGEGAR